MTQLSLPIADLGPCLACDGERFVEPPWSGMELEPCIICNAHAWERWNLDPYALHLDPHPLRAPFNYWRTPERVGQLGLGLITTA